MIEPNAAVEAFREKLSKMSYDEREQYLKKMGISFSAESSEGDKSRSSNSNRRRSSRKVGGTRVAAYKAPAVSKKPKRGLALTALKAKD